MDKISYIEEQYDKIYRYCYYRLHSREAAEDITQETFFRFLKNTTYHDTGQSLHYLYSIARNLCINEHHRPKAESLPPEMETNFSEDALLTSISMKSALEKLSQEERELLLLRYANEVPVTVIAQMLGLSRFAVHRRISGGLKKLEKRLQEEELI
ncbi:MAG: RNA polymerase sigma factor [bacterium]|nr:RNA polymerase sigma factor [bacterium]MCM1373553.1 RNA polymerase sigma factor [Muribaculum sp.]